MLDLHDTVQIPFFYYLGSASTVLRFVMLCNRLCWLLDVIWCCHCIFTYPSSMQTGHTTPGAVSQVENRGGPPLRTCWLRSVWHSPRCCWLSWLMFNFLSSRITRSFSEKLFPRQPTLHLHCCMSFFHPRCKTFYLPLLSSMKFPTTHFSSLWKSLWTSALLCRVLTAPLLSLVLTANWSHQPGHQWKDKTLPVPVLITEGHY